MKFNSAIFDLDGTVIDSEWAWAKSLKNVLNDLGIHEKRKYPQIGGIGVPANWKILKETYGLGKEPSVEKLTKSTFDEFLKLIPRIKPMKGFVILIKKFRIGRIKTALATSTERPMVEEVLKNLPIKDYFDSITTGEEVVHRKPAPDIFLKAAEKIKSKPDECLVFEDAESGVTAAHRAGMKVVALARDEEYKKILKEADMVIRNFEEFPFS